jgi:hypothetical protein
MDSVPSPNGDNGQAEARDEKGRFLPGNPGGPGNPHAVAVAAWRKAIVLTVSPADLEAVIRVLLERAKAGEPWAVKELLDRCLGRAPAEAEDPAPPPPRVKVNLDLVNLLADRMAAGVRQPSVPGLAPPRLTNDGPDGSGQHRSRRRAYVGSQGGPELRTASVRPAGPSGGPTATPGASRRP